MKHADADGFADCFGSRPARGAWIETEPMAAANAPTRVAPRAGRVD